MSTICLPNTSSHWHGSKRIWLKITFIQSLNKSAQKCGCNIYIVTAQNYKNGLLQFLRVTNGEFCSFISQVVSFHMFIQYRTRFISTVIGGFYTNYETKYIFIS